MKKICLILAIPLLLQACLKYEKDLFPKNSAERMEQAITHAKETLKSSPNGWIMEYYPSETFRYGGIIMLVNFKDGDSVTVASERIQKKDSTYTSLYAVIPETGPVLTFNTFNPIFHYYSHPRNPDGFNVTANTGMQGDYEFIVISATPAVITLKGKRTGNTIILRRLAEGISWSDYLTSLPLLWEQMWSEPTYSYTSDQGAAVVRLMPPLFTSTGQPFQIRRLAFSYWKDGAFDSIIVPFVMDPKGIRLYNPLNLFGNTIAQLDYDAENDWFTIPGHNGKVEPRFSMGEALRIGNWYFKFSEMGTATRASWNATRNALRPDREVLRFAYLGTTGNTFAFYFAFTDNDGAGTTYAGNLEYSWTLLADHRVKLSYTGRFGGNGNFYYGKGVNHIIGMLGEGEEGKIYDITTDNPKNPTWLRLQDISNENNWFILDKTEVLWPFNN